jgi:hypothetical protein
MNPSAGGQGDNRGSLHMESYYEVEITRLSSNVVSGGVVYHVTAYGREKVAKINRIGELGELDSAAEQRLRTPDQIAHEKDAVIQKATKIARRHRDNIIRLDID